MGHTLFFADPVPVEHVKDAFTETGEVSSSRTVAKIVGSTTRSVFSGPDVIQVCAGAYVREGPDDWRWYSDPEWEA